MRNPFKSLMDRMTRKEEFEPSMTQGGMLQTARAKMAELDPEIWPVEICCPNCKEVIALLLHPVPGSLHLRHVLECLDTPIQEHNRLDYCPSCGNTGKYMTWLVRDAENRIRSAEWHKEQFLAAVLNMERNPEKAFDDLLYDIVPSRASRWASLIDTIREVLARLNERIEELEKLAIGKRLSRLEKMLARSAMDMIQVEETLKELRKKSDE